MVLKRIFSPLRCEDLVAGANAPTIALRGTRRDLSFVRGEGESGLDRFSL
jgi:hypothetical protein